MTIANTKASNVFNANGVTRDFALGFVYDENVSGISIKVIDSEGTETEVTSNYTIYNGVLTYPTVDSGLDPLATGYKITIERLTPHTQTIDLIQQGPLDAETLEGGYDKLTMEVQELQDASDRSIKFPLQTEGETDAQAYIDELTALKDTATAAATTATSEAGIATAAATAAATSESNAEKWAEGTDAQVEALGGTHSAKNWAAVAQSAAESEAVQTVAENIEDINTVAGIQSDVTQVSSIAAAVSNVSDHDTEVNTVYDNLSSVITTATNINDVNAVAGIKNDVVAVSGIKTNVTAVAGNSTNINAVAANESNINAVNANKTNIDTVAGASTNINTVATNISDVTSIATAIADVSAVADDLTNIDNVADDLTNIDTVAASLPDIQDKQNKVLTNSVILGGETQTTVEGALEAISEDWVKPADWPDMRSGAMDNSIYLLIGHSADYSTYPQFDFSAKISNGGTYDVYIDGIKKFTTASEATTSINWQTLALTSGRTTTHPTNLVIHTVCITPTSYSNTFLEVKEVLGNYQNKGLLWAHFEIDYAIVNQISSSGGAQYRNPILEAITAKNDELKFNGSASTLFWNCEKLQYVPKLDLSQLQKVNYYSLRGAQNLKKIRVSAGAITVGDSLFQNAYSLTELPPLNFQTNDININNFLGGVTELKDTTLNFSRTPTKKLTFGGTSSKRIDGLKGLTVNSSAPFDNATAPQLDVKYTGLDRAALVNLFKSMPYNVGYTVVGSPTITDGVASGFSKNNYLSLGNFPQNVTDLEIQIKFKTGSASDVDVWQGLFSINPYESGHNVYIRYNRNNRQIAFSPNFTYATENWILTSSTLEYETWYTYKISKVGNVYTLYKDGVVEATATSSLAIEPGNLATRLGWASVYSTATVGGFNSSIDLKNTYIKVNGVPWFTGKAAMTKTCSIVGCTGTADLTQADKDIALDKGWSLTVA